MSRVGVAVAYGLNRETLLQNALTSGFWLPRLVVVRVVPAAVPPPGAALFAGLSDTGR